MATGDWTYSSDKSACPASWLPNTGWWNLWGNSRGSTGTFASTCFTIKSGSVAAACYRIATSLFACSHSWVYTSLDTGGTQFQLCSTSGLWRYMAHLKTTWLSKLHSTKEPYAADAHNLHHSWKPFVHNHCRNLHTRVEINSTDCHHKTGSP